MSRVAQLLQSLTLAPAEIAAVARLSVERIYAIMEGAPPSLLELRALSRGLRLPIGAFASGHRASDAAGELGLLFRGAIQEAAPDQRATVDYVAGFVDAALKVLPQRSSPPNWLLDLAPSKQTFEEAHRLAHGFRSMFMAEDPDGPALLLPQVVAEQGDIVFGGLRLSRYEGASLIAGGYGFLFVSPRFRARMLFTVAHELGHIIAHHQNNTGAVFDRVSNIGSARQANLNERFVDAFASVLLLPERGVALALRSIRKFLQKSSGQLGDVELLYLARYYGVSFEVAARRCEQLELLPEGGAVSLAEALKRDFGSPERRAETLGLPPRAEIVVPRVSDNLLRPLIGRIEEGSISSGWAAERFGLGIDDIFQAHVRLTREHRH